jgi:hypothetical protein
MDEHAAHYKPVITSEMLLIAASMDIQIMLPWAVQPQRWPATCMADGRKTSVLFAETHGAISGWLAGCPSDLWLRCCQDDRARAPQAGAAFQQFG